MKNKFSKTWKASKQPRKQRKYRYNIPMHMRKKLLSVNLAKPLREKYNLRNIPIRKEDVVKVMRGQFKGKSGKVTKVLTKKCRVYIENITNIKKDGTKIMIPINVSNLQIIEIKMDDKKRRKIVERKQNAKKEPSVKIGSTKKLANKEKAEQMDNKTK